MIPDVSVVVISYNDAARLPRAIRSVQRQTLRNLEIIVVDDASTDDTEAVVRRLAAGDPRIRYERLAQNSGGCSAPRNRGLEIARAPWIMFCDSDDEYERHACKNLLSAAERTGADVVCGTAERIDARTGRVKRWRPEVHDQEQVADALADLPDLLYDTISVNKIYRADLITANDLRFPEGLLFEDQLFTLQAMASASRIATIPEVVYRWYVDRLSDEPSITQRRNEARNVDSRIEINRQIDAYLDSRGLLDLRRVKDLKFLRHDLYLYLSSMLEVDDETARTLMERLQPYVAASDLSRAWEVRPALRVAIYHLLVQDLDGVRAAMRFVKWASVVDVPIREQDGREFWGCAHLDDGPAFGDAPARAWLDVTALGVLRIPFTQRRYLHRIDTWAVDGDIVTVEGSTVDYDGSLDDVEHVELRGLIGGERTAFAIPAMWTGTRGDRRTWRAHGHATDHLLRPLAQKDRGTIGVALVRAHRVNVTGARAAEADVPNAHLPAPGPRTSTGPAWIDLVPSDNGAIGWRAARPLGTAARLDRWRERWFRLPGTRRLAVFAALVRTDALPGVAARLGGVLPARRVAMIDAGARSADPGVVAVAAALAEHRPDVRQVWTYSAEPGRLPAGADGVRVGSARYGWLMGRAGIRVEDGRSSTAVRGRRSAVVINAGEAVPVHRIGLDDPSVLVSRAATAGVRRRARRWTVLAAPSEMAGRALASAYGYRGRVAATGLARMDAALRHTSSPEGVDALRLHLDLPLDRAIVVYVPAPRATDGYLLDLERWVEEMGNEAYLVVRDGTALTLPTRLRRGARLLPGPDDLALMIAASHLVVSDYSSWIGDAALADRPVVLFQPDRDTYVGRTHGVYSDLDAVGPIVRTQEALVDELRRWTADPVAWDVVHGPSRRGWAVRAGSADGRAGARLIEAVIT